jgi:hypothetical protein
MCTPYGVLRRSEEWEKREKREKRERVEPGRRTRIRKYE